METPLISEAFVLVREALAKRNRMVSAREAPAAEIDDEEEEEEVPPPVVEKTDEAEKMISALHWLWAAHVDDETITPFPSAISQDKRAIDWAKKLTFENLRST